MRRGLGRIVRGRSFRVGRNRDTGAGIGLEGKSYRTGENEDPGSNAARRSGGVTRHTITPKLFRNPNLGKTLLYHPWSLSVRAQYSIALERILLTDECRLVRMGRTSQRRLHHDEGPCVWHASGRKEGPQEHFSR